MSVEKGVEQIFGAALEADARDKTAEGSPSQTAVPLNFSAEAPSETATRPMSALAGWVMQQFRQNVDHRKNCGPDGVSVEMRLQDAIMAQTCKYSPESQARLAKAGIPKRVYAPITATKVRAAKAMLNDLVSAGGDPLFAMCPSPDPDVPAEIEAEVMNAAAMELHGLFAQFQSQGVTEIPPEMFARIQDLMRVFVNGQYDRVSVAKDEYARNRAKRMEKKVWDMMVEGGWDKAFCDYVDYICTYGTGIIVGPVLKNVAVNTCVEIKGSDGETAHMKKYERVVKSVPTFEALNPIDCYPAPDAKGVADGPLCVRVKYTANELWRYADGTSEKADVNDDSLAEGWNEKAVQRVLALHPNGGVHLTENQKNQVVRGAENQAGENYFDCTFEGVRCFSSVRGSLIADMGITKNRDGSKIRLNAFYYAEVIVIDGVVVYCRIYDDRLGVPLSKGVFYELPGSWWGECIADKMVMVQYTMNTCIKSLLQNMGVASGPMYWMNDVSRLADKSPDGLKMFPHKIWAFSNSLVGNSGAPMGVLTIPSNATELIAVFDKMKIQADDDSGIPAYTYGQSSGQGALRTSSGLAILSEAASRGMKMVISTTDRLVIADVAKRCADWILLYDDDMSLKGDVYVKPVGLMGKILKAQQDQQRLQMFNLIVGNQFLLNLVGVRGVCEMLRPTVNDLNINPDNIIPSDEKIKEMETVAAIKQIFEATSAAQGVQQNVAETETAGAPSGIEQPPNVPGGVAERRGAA